MKLCIEALSWGHLRIDVGINGAGCTTFIVNRRGQNHGRGARQPLQDLIYWRRTRPFPSTGIVAIHGTDNNICVHLPACCGLLRLTHGKAHGVLWNKRSIASLSCSSAHRRRATPALTTRISSGPVLTHRGDDGIPSKRYPSGWRYFRFPLLPVFYRRLRAIRRS